MSGPFPFPHRIRRPLDHYANSELRFHITINAHPEIARWPDNVGNSIWRIVQEQRGAGRVELFAACLMPDHLHLLLRPDGMDVIRFVNVWKSWTTTAAWKLGHRGPLWQPGMWDRTIRDPADFDSTVDYIVHNPRAVGLVEEAREWPWSWAWFWDD